MALISFCLEHYLSWSELVKSTCARAPVQAVPAPMQAAVVPGKQGIFVTNPGPCAASCGACCTARILTCLLQAEEKAMQVCAASSWPHGRPVRYLNRRQQAVAHFEQELPDDRVLLLDALTQVLGRPQCLRSERLQCLQVHIAWSYRSNQARDGRLCARVPRLTRPLIQVSPWGRLKLYCACLRAAQEQRYSTRWICWGVSHG